MKKSLSLVIHSIFVAILILAAARTACPAGEIFDDRFLEFVGKIDTDALERMPVQHHGRIAVLDTFARDRVHGICGEEFPDGVAPASAWMELYFNSGRYLTVPLLYIREDLMRNYLLAQDLGLFEEDFKRNHRIPPAILINSEGLQILARRGRLGGEDNLKNFSLIRKLGLAGKIRDVYGDRAGEYKVPVDRLSGRFGLFLAADSARVIPSAGMNWKTAFDAVSSGESIAGRMFETKEGRKFELSPLIKSWTRLRAAWLGRDPEMFNRSLETFLTLQAEADRDGDIPSETLKKLEIWFNLTGKFSSVWTGFAAALIVMIAAAATGNRKIKIAGMILIGASTAILAGGFTVRWVLSNREWYLPPLMNQFEAVMGSALLAAMGGFLIELFHRRNYIALGGAFYATLALLSCQFFSRLMGGDISNPAGILNSIWMAAHVAVIVVGHAFVGISFILSVFYLVIRVFADRGSKQLSSGPDLVGLPPRNLFAAVDQCNLIVAQIACWSVIVGTILGAVWADVAWGRFWGWDPKETWALVTALLFVALLHLRFMVPDRNRGLVTAIVCILGCGAMLFNWIVVNYFLAGMHSYA